MKAPVDSLSRDHMLDRAAEMRPWDVVVVGGGCTGIATALDAASRGYRTLLLERGDFTAGTSSRSTKLIHGGVRYLRQGEIELVYGALRERHRLMRNAPHLVRELALIVPAYRWWERAYLGTGLAVYDALARGRGLSRSRRLSRRACLDRVSTLRTGAARRGALPRRAVRRRPSRLDDDPHRDQARLRGPQLRGGGGLVGSREAVKGVRVRDRLGGSEWEVRGAVVVNAAGPFADSIRRMDEPGQNPAVVLSRGAHIVVSSAFLPGHAAVLSPGPTTAGSSSRFPGTATS